MSHACSGYDDPSYFEIEQTRRKKPYFEGSEALVEYFMQCPRCKEKITLVVENEWDTNQIKREDGS